MLGNNGEKAVTFGTDALFSGIDPKVAEGLATLMRMGPDEFLAGSDVLNAERTGPLTHDDKVLLASEIRDALYQQSARDMGAMSDARKPVPYGADKAEVAKGQPTVVVYSTIDGRTVGRQTFSTAAQAKAVAEAVGRQVRVGDDFFDQNIQFRAGQKMRNGVGPFFLGWNPAVFIPNFAGMLMYAVTGGHNVMDARSPWRIAKRANMLEHLGKLYSGLADVTERGIGDMGEQAYFGKEPTNQGKLRQFLTQGPMRGLLRQNEKDMALRFYYAGVMEFMRKFGPIARDDVIIPDLQRLGLTPEQAAKVGNAFYDAAMGEGADAAVKSALDTINGLKPNMTLSDLDAGWADYLPPKAALAFEQILQQSRTPAELEARLSQFMQDLASVEDEKLLYNQGVGGRISDELSTVSNEFSDFANYGRNPNIKPEEFKAALKRISELQRGYMTKRSELANFLQGHVNVGTAAYAYDVWVKLRDMRVKIQERLDNLAEDIARDKNGYARWSEHMKLSEQLWKKFYEKDAPDVFAKAADNIRNGVEVHNPTVGPNFLDWATVDESELWTRLQEQTGVPAKDPAAFKRVRDAGRSLMDIAEARIYAAAMTEGVPAHVMMDYAISFERDKAGAAAAVKSTLANEKARLRLDGLEGDALNNAYYPLANAAWREYNTAMWDAAMKHIEEMVTPYITKNVPSAEKPAFVQKWMDGFKRDITSKTLKPEDVQRTIGRIRKIASDLGITTLTKGETQVKRIKGVTTMKGRIARANFGIKLAQAFNLDPADAEHIASLVDFFATRYAEALGLDNLDDFYTAHFADMQRGGAPVRDALYQAINSSRLSSLLGLAMMNPDGGWTRDSFQKFTRVMSELPKAMQDYFENDYPYESAEFGHYDPFIGPEHIRTEALVNSEGRGLQGFVIPQASAVTSYDAQGVPLTRERRGSRLGLTNTAYKRDYENTIHHELTHFVWPEIIKDGNLTRQMTEHFIEVMTNRAQDAFAMQPMVNKKPIIPGDMMMGIDPVFPTPKIAWKLSDAEFKRLFMNTDRIFEAYDAAGMGPRTIEGQRYAAEYALSDYKSFKAHYDDTLNALYQLVEKQREYAKELVRLHGNWDDTLHKWLTVDELMAQEIAYKLQDFENQFGYRGSVQSEIAAILGIPSGQAGGLFMMNAVVKSVEAATGIDLQSASRRNPANTARNVYGAEEPMAFSIGDTRPSTQAMPAGNGGRPDLFPSGVPPIFENIGKPALPTSMSGVWEMPDMNAVRAQGSGAYNKMRDKADQAGTAPATGPLFSAQRPAPEGGGPGRPVMGMPSESDIILGSTEFQNDATAVLRGFAGSDPATAIHEVAHVLRRAYNRMAEAGDVAAQKHVAEMESHYGIENGTWGASMRSASSRTSTCT